MNRQMQLQRCFIQKPCNLNNLRITQLKTALTYDEWSEERIQLQTNNLHGDGMLTGTGTADDLTMNCTQGRDDELGLKMHVNNLQKENINFD